MQLDGLAAHIAQRAMAATPAAGVHARQPANLQLAASCALLASVLAPASCRPVNLPQASRSCRDLQYTVMLHQCATIT